MTHRIDHDDGVSTGSGSDRVSTHAMVEIAKTVTRSLPLPVLTSSLNTIRDGSHETARKEASATSIEKH